jgi:hypothetical protein
MAIKLPRRYSRSETCVRANGRLTSRAAPMQSSSRREVVPKDEATLRRHRLRTDARKLEPERLATDGTMGGVTQFDRSLGGWSWISVHRTDPVTN